MCPSWPPRPARASRFTAADSLRLPFFERVRFEFNIPFDIILLLANAAARYSAGYFYLFKGFEIGNVSIVSAVVNLWAVFRMLFAYLFMDQGLTTAQPRGIFMMITDVTMVLLNRGDIKRHRFTLSSGVKRTGLGAFLGVFWRINEIL